MKTSPAKLRVAFLDPGNAPDDDAFETMLGAAFAPVGEIFSRLRDTLPGISHASHYSQKSGWYGVVSLKRRRFLYLIPKHNDFRLSSIIGPRAITSL